MVLDFLNRNPSLTLATGLVCGTGQSQRIRKRKFTLDHVVEWVEKYENIDGHFCFVKAYAHLSPLYQQAGKRLLSMTSIGSMDVECMAKLFKHCILTKTKNRNALSNEKEIVLFRAEQNLNHLHHAHKVIKRNVYGGVINSDCDLAE
jgi:hypothetical protein